MVRAEDFGLIRHDSSLFRAAVAAACYGFGLRKKTGHSNFVHNKSG